MDKNLLDYFIQHTNDKFSELKSDLKELKSDVEDLNKFKWKLTGIAISVMTVAEVARAIFLN